MMRKMTSLMLAAMLTTAAVPQAYAATVDAQGAEALKKTMQDSLAYPLAAAMHKMQGMTMSGPVEVAPKDGYYEVKLPDVAFVAPDLYTVKVGTIVANMAPGDHGEYMTTLALPSPIELDDGKGQKIGDVTIGAQHFTGTYRPDLVSLTQLDADYKDVSIKSAGETPFTVMAKEIKNTMNLTDNGDGTWSGPIGFDVTGLQTTTQSTRVGTIDAGAGHFKAEYVADKMNLKGRKEAQDKLLDVLNKQAPGQTSPEDAGKISMGMLETAAGFVNGIDSSYLLENADLKITPLRKAEATDGGKKDAAPAADTSPTHLTLAKLTSHVKTEGMQDNAAGFHFQFGFSGLSVDGAPKDVLSGTIPTSGAVDVAVKNLPMKTLSATLSSGFSQAVQSSFGEQDMTGESMGDVAARAAMKKQAQMQMLAAVATVPAALAAAGTTLEIGDTHIDAPDLGTQLKGKITASAASPMKAVGNMVLSFTGLDELLQKVQAMAQSPDSSPRLMAASQWMMMVQMMGQVEKSPDGKTVRVFKFELTPDGKALMNGKNLGEAIGAGATMMQAHQPPAQGPGQ
jgi:hypothetical protein